MLGRTLLSAALDLGVDFDVDVDLGVDFDFPILAVAGVHDWSEHKKHTFRPEHIRAAWRRLPDGDWF